MEPGKLYESWEKIYDTFTQNENYQRYWRDRHEKHGALRSGEGTTAEVLDKMR